MDAREKNKIKCKEYYQKTKNNLTEAQKERRRETSRLAQQRFYEKNRELCIQRNIECRNKRPKKYKKVLPKKDNDSFLNEKLSIQKVIELKAINFYNYVIKFPNLRLWDKKLNQWTYKDYFRFKKLNLN